MFPHSSRYLVQRSQTNDEVKARIGNAIGPYEDFLTSVKRRKLKSYGPHDHLDWPRLSYREQLKEGDTDADRGNDGKTMSKRGPSLNGISYYREPRGVEEAGWL